MAKQRVSSNENSPQSRQQKCSRKQRVSTLMQRKILLFSNIPIPIHLLIALSCSRSLSLRLPIPYSAFFLKYSLVAFFQKSRLLSVYKNIIKLTISNCILFGISKCNYMCTGFPAVTTRVASVIISLK